MIKLFQRRKIKLESFLASSNCHPDRLGFNGGFNCTGTQTEFRCALYCPESVDMIMPESIVSNVYDCDYATGAFTPDQVPECDYGRGVRLVKTTKVTKHTRTKYVANPAGSLNWTWVMQGGSRRRQRGWSSSLSILRDKKWVLGQGLVDSSTSTDDDDEEDFDLKKYVKKVKAGFGWWFSANQELPSMDEQGKKRLTLLSRFHLVSLES